MINIRRPYFTSAPNFQQGGRNKPKIQPRLANICKRPLFRPNNIPNSPNHPIIERSSQQNRIRKRRWLREVPGPRITHSRRCGNAV
jgi:hypothetical protein